MEESSVKIIAARMSAILRLQNATEALEEFMGGGYVMSFLFMLKIVMR